MTKRRKICIILPFSIVGCFLLYSWTQFLFNDYVPQVAHYLGLLLFLPILYFLFLANNYKKALLTTGAYLILSTINLLSFNSGIITTSFGISIGSTQLYSPAVNGWGFVLLLFYGIINFDNLVEVELDYKEAKGKL